MCGTPPAPPTPYHHTTHHPCTTRYAVLGLQVKQMEEIQFSAEAALPGHHYASRDGGKEASGLQLPARTKRLALEAADMMGKAPRA